MRQDSEPTGAPQGEPYEREEMSLIKNGGSVSVTIPVFAVKLCGYERGQQVPVEVYDDGVWIATGDDHE